MGCQVVMKVPGLAKATVKSSVPVTAASLETAGFPGCVQEGGIPCEAARSIRYNGPDPSSNMLECGFCKKFLTGDDASGCPKTHFG